jgi:hypothetical protein
LAEARTSRSCRAPAGGVEPVNDVMRYVIMELNEGAAGRPAVHLESAACARAPQVVVGTDITYGMGLFVTRSMARRSSTTAVT